MEAQGAEFVSGPFDADDDSLFVQHENPGLLIGWQS